MAVEVLKKTIFLTFTPRSAPYAEVAAYLLSGGSMNNLKLGLKSDLSCSEPTLLIPKGALDFIHGPTASISGKPTIARFLSRLNTSDLYEKRPASEQVEVDGIIDLVRLEKKNELLKQLEQLKTPFILQSISLADLLVWDALRSTAKLTPKVSSWIQSIEAVPLVQQAKSLVNRVLLSVPLISNARLEIAEKVSKALNQPIDTSVIQTSRDKQNGDLIIPIPRLKLPGNPQQLAQEIAAKIPTDSLIEKVAANGPFLNFFISRDYMRRVILNQALELKSEFGSNHDGFAKMAVVEFSSPNIAKPFHAGHLRSTIIGNFCQNVLKMNGWSTKSINYLGDWGKQYGLLALGFEKYGSRELLEKDPIRHLFDVYVKINADAKDNDQVDEQARAYFKKMEDGDTLGLKLWKEFRDLSIVKYKEIYARLNVAFDVYSGESQYSLSQMKDVLDELRSLGLLVPDAGAEIVNMKDIGLGAAVIAKSDGSMLYLSRDIAAAISRQEEYNFDKMYYIVGNQQDHHFKQLFKILELMNKPWAQECVHINFGLIKSKDGQMSTRRGTVVFLEDILDHTMDEMHSIMRQNTEKYAQIQNPELVSDLVGISSIVVQDMGARRHKDYEFDWSRMLSFEGDTGPYLQYAHSRLSSIERTYGKTVDFDKVDLSLLSEPQAMAIIEYLATWPDVVREAANTMEPNGIVTWMFELCHRVSTAIEVLWVKGREEKLAEARMALFIATRITLSSALRLVGLRPLERM